MDIPIRDESIRLGQLLKLAGLVEDGAQAKELLADDAVTVDGEPESRRGRQVAVGAVVEVSLPRGVERVVVTSA
ncbi:MAG TPA: RNA-binding protein [Micrococcales bacterium]|uniref:RNA-binding S4 domain-containing protein n=1 Tax=Miniimonas arenae TaxID=676201 RepID=A0A5C5BFU4_9MICO|nr:MULTISPECIES: RNA-binding S4 domain-containing protein [Miniimonas]TNU77236.1 RNA-binding S4 domain-containing protein [Miniimonas arenae]HCX83919.1 RNA-binding protein [Micrococcales bacterium]